MKAEIETHRIVGEAGIKNINVLLVGEISSGKSSFFNTVESVFAGHVRTRADTGTDDTSLTKKVRLHFLTQLCFVMTRAYCFCVMVLAAIVSLHSVGRLVIVFNWHRLEAHKLV